MEDMAVIARDFNVTCDVLIKDIMSLSLFKRVGDYIRPISKVMLQVTDANGDSYMISNQAGLDIWCEIKGLEKNYIKLLIMD
ncbi:MAG: hypothetical protein LKI85_08300 [Enterobacter sp.]|nr:hypothetical protein [Enterobacter sp.]